MDEDFARRSIEMLSDAYETDPHWIAFEQAFEKVNKFKPHPRDSLCREKFFWYLIGVQHQAAR